MDELLGIDLIDCAGDNLAAVAPMVIFPASADKRVITRYGEVTSASFARPGSATYVAASGEVKQVGVGVPRVGSTGWILEGSATNVALWSNSFTAEHGHTLKDCTTSVSPTEYLLTDESGAPRYATTLTATADIGRVGRYNISVTSGTKVNWSIHVKAISGKFRFAGYDGSKAVSVLFDCATRTFSGLSDPSAISSQLQYEYLGNGWFRLSVTITPTVTSSTAAASIGLELSGNSGFISGAQFVVGPVVTSYIYTEASSVTRASEGADTSGNGLSIPLSQAMVDSLKGEMIDWSTTWTYSADPSYYSISGKTITCASGADVIRAAYKSGALTTGQVYEISYTVSGLSGGSMRAFFGASGNAATVGLPVISTDGTYIGRDIATNGTTIGVRFNVGATGSVTINYCRRVLESGQTNPGEGTIVQWVNLPWDSVVIPSDSAINFLTSTDATNRHLCIRRFSGGNFHMVSLYDGVFQATIPNAEYPSGQYLAVAQWSSALGRMRVGLYNPATDTLTWSHSTLAGGQTYRGFFQIHSTNRLRFFYGGGNFPIHVGGLRWSNSIVSDAECVRLSKEMLP